MIVKRACPLISLAANLSKYSVLISTLFPFRLGGFFLDHHISFALGVKPLLPGRLTLFYMANLMLESFSFLPHHILTIIPMPRYPKPALLLQNALLKVTHPRTEG